MSECTEGCRGKCSFKGSLVQFLNFFYILYNQVWSLGYMLLSFTYEFSFRGCYYLFTYFIQQSPWAANRFSASQEIPCIFWNLKVHYWVCKCPPSVCILSQINSVHVPHPMSWRVILILVLPFYLCLCLPSLFFPSGCPTKILYSPLPSPIHVMWPTHLTLRFDHQNNVWWV